MFGWDTDNRRRRLSAGARGFSLVEILVVLVVLVLGMLAIARLFPGGFATLGFTAKAAAGSSAERAALAYAKAHQEGLPDAIVGLNHDANRWGNGDFYWWDFPINQNRVALPYVVQGFNGTQPDDARFSDIDYQRRILGERLMIPPPSTVNTPNNEAACLYNALFAPIYSAQPLYPAAAPSMSTVALGVSAYSGTPMRRVQFSFPPTTQNWQDLTPLGDFGYGIDYGDPVACPAPAAGSTTRNPTLYLLSATFDRVFKVDLGFHTPAGVSAQAPPDNWLVVPASNSAGLQLTIDLGCAVTQQGLSFFGVPAGASVDSGSEAIYRRFLQLPVATAFSNNNPYEYKVYDTTTGLFAFNPLAASLSIPQQQGRGLMVKIDYDVDDWHILRQDEIVPLQPVDATGAYAIRLVQGGIKKVGDTEETINFITGQPSSSNSFLYQGLVRFYPDTPTRTGTPGVDLIAVDLETGLALDSTTCQPGGANGDIDYNTGTFHLAKSISLKSPVTGAVVAAVNPAGRHIRVFYRTYTDLGVSLQKASARYYLFPGIGPVQHEQYSATYGAGYLLFPLTDVGKTVAVDYSYVRQMQAGNGTVTKTYPIVGEMHQIQPPDAATANVFGPLVGVAGPQGWVRLSNADPDTNHAASNGNSDPAVVANSIQVSAVRGSSLHSWSSWRAAGRWQQREQSTLQARDDVRQ